jgi:hypothetical protein
MKSVTFLAPAILCAIIAFPSLLISAQKEHNWPQVLFCAFMPACFFVLAAVMLRMNRDLSRLRRRIGKLENKLAPSGPFSSVSGDASRTAADNESTASSA